MNPHRSPFSLGLWPFSVGLCSVLFSLPVLGQGEGSGTRRIDRPIISSKGLSDTQRIQHLLSRFAFGPTPGMVGRVRAMGVDKWIEEQLSPGGQDSQRERKLLARYRTLGMSSQVWLTELRRIQKSMGKNPGRKARAKLNAARRLPLEETKDLVLIRALYSPWQLRETACDFFRNHFNVEASKGSVRYFLQDWERRVIRETSLLGFRDYLYRSAKHPAMLLYLDNAVSRKPPTKAELNALKARVRTATKSRAKALESVEIAKQRGLNENYARELFELHTLGVDNVYRQRDIIELAKVLTGWTVDSNPASKRFGFVFRADMHQRGEKRVLGLSVRPDRKAPLSEGEAVLNMLAKHGGTARFLAWKLCRYYVADDPPKPLVDRVARAWKRSGGDLKTVYRAILKDPLFYAPEHFQTKFKRPFEFVLSALRVTGAEVTRFSTIRKVLASLNEPLYECVDPTGYYDQAEAWNDPGVMAGRWSFAMALATGKLPGVRIPRSFFLGLHPKLPQVWKDQLAGRILTAGLGDKTSAVLDRLIRKELEKNKEPDRVKLGSLIVGLLLGSPEFQRQ